MRTISRRELRNDIARVLREVEGGARFCITVDGLPVANLVPIGGARRTFVPREDAIGLLEQAPWTRDSTTTLRWRAAQQSTSCD
jgi:prevent-host-death family protein